MVTQPHLLRSGIRLSEIPTIKLQRDRCLRMVTHSPPGGRCVVCRGLRSASAAVPQVARLVAVLRTVGLRLPFATLADIFG